MPGTYFVARGRPDDPFDEILPCIGELFVEGKVRYFALSAPIHATTSEIIRDLTIDHHRSYQGNNGKRGEWGSVIVDARLVAAVIDRVTFNAHIIETGPDSYRLRTRRTRTGAQTSKRARTTPTPRCRVGPNT